MKHTATQHVVILRQLRAEHQRKLAAYLKYAARCEPLLSLLYKNPSAASLNMRELAAHHTWDAACERLRDSPDLYGELASPTPSYAATALRMCGLSPSTPYRPAQVARNLSHAILSSKKTLAAEQEAADKIRQFESQYPDLMVQPQILEPSKVWASMAKGLPSQRADNKKKQPRLTVGKQQQLQEEPTLN